LKQSEWLNQSREQFREFWYSTEYTESSYTGLAGRAHKRIHESIESGHSRSFHFPKSLELGANVGEHLDYVKHTFDEYVVSDLVNRLQPAQSKKIMARGARFEVQDVTKLSYPDNTFDRVLHLCLLPHVNDPEVALMEIRRVLTPGGTADIYVGSDPGLLFRLGRFLGPTRKAFKKGIGKVKTLMDAREHPIHARAILRMAEQVFRFDQVKKTTYPLNFAPHELTLWTHLRITKNPRKTQ
jgi:phosphatidylethanolamine/phosphatidyl-N-methylethanolamine N-methyltransferase